MGPHDLLLSSWSSGSNTSRKRSGESTEPWQTPLLTEGRGGCFAEAYVRVDVGVPVFDEAPGFSCYASVLKVSEKNWIFHSVKCRGQIIEAGVDGVTITDEFGDGFLAREGLGNVRDFEIF